MKGYKKIFLAQALLLSFSISAQAAVLANVGGKPISDDEIKKEYEQMGDEQRNAVNKDLVAKKSIVDSAVNTEVLYQAAKKAGMDGEKDFQMAVERFKRQYLAAKFIEKGVESKLSNSGSKKFFESHKNLFDSTQVCAYHIVVSDEKEAARVAEMAKVKDTKFEELAKKHSIDPTVQENKGDLGCFTRERMVPQFADAAFAMKKNEVRGPVVTSFGYHVIKVYDVKPGKVPTYDEVEQRVKETYRMKMMQDLIADLRSKANVKINEEEVKKLKL